MHRAQLAAVIISSLLCLPLAPLAGQAPAPHDDAAREEFLRKGRIVRTRSAGKGVTDSTRATLQLGELTHDVHIQTIDKSQREFNSSKGVELNFRDKWQFNVAAYKIDRLIGLHVVPVTVERRWNQDPASFTWWVDDVLMDEGERQKKKVAPPQPECWNEQVELLRLFDQLIDNIDRNTGNMIITQSWRLWGIDHTRAFRRSRTPARPDRLTRADRQLLARLEALDFPTLKREVTRYIEDADVRALLSRRDAILAHFKPGGESVLFDMRDMTAGCLAAAAAVH